MLWLSAWDLLHPLFRRSLQLDLSSSCTANHESGCILRILVGSYWMIAIMKASSTEA